MPADLPPSARPSAPRLCLGSDQAGVAGASVARPQELERQLDASKRMARAPEAEELAAVEARLADVCARAEARCASTSPPSLPSPTLAIAPRSPRGSVLRRRAPARAVVRGVGAQCAALVTRR